MSEEAGLLLLHKEAISRIGIKNLIARKKFRQLLEFILFKSWNRNLKS